MAEVTGPNKLKTLAYNASEEKIMFGITETTWQCVEQLLREDWSPQQIHLWLRSNGEPTVSQESIYQYIY